VSAALEQAFDESRLLAVDERLEVVRQVQLFQASDEDQGLKKKKIVHFFNSSVN
jgi:hypothetical protein